MEIKKLKKINDYEWELPKKEEMLVPGRIFAKQKLVKEMDEKVLEQLRNVSCLPGIQRYSLAMPDAHWGYGFPIGGIGAFDLNDGIISVGGVGFDAGCGVRTLKTNLTVEEIKPRIKEIIDRLFNAIPVGLGIKGKIMLKDKEVKEVMQNGALWAIEKGYGEKKELEYIEDNGKIINATPENVSKEAIAREKKQIGTLGSGNHYLEIQAVNEIYDSKKAKTFGIEKENVLISFHCGSRALGHQIGADYLKILAEASRKYKIPIKEKELVCAPIQSIEGKKYYGAVGCALNYAYANRQIISYLIQEELEKIFKHAKTEILYEVTHNSTKIEKHEIEKKNINLLVHRKGATRAFGPENKSIPKKYSSIGQPVIIGGSMGTSSYILHGTNEAMKKTFGSSCHGAGRAKSRTLAKKENQGIQLVNELLKKGIYVKARSINGLLEESPDAYKNVDEVVDSMHNSGIALKIAKLKPLGNLKG